MEAGEWERAVADAIGGLHASHSHRRLRTVRQLDSVQIELDGRRLINFSSNDYLGLARHPDVTDAAARAIERFGAGTGASPLICGRGPAHAAAERRIARWKGTESALLFPSGYQANHAAVQTLAAIAARTNREIRFLLDRLCHASLIDAVRGSGMPFRVFPHNRLDRLRHLLEDSPSGRLEAVMTESIFSMDGDAADLIGLARLKAERPFLLLLDEAHASGVYGPDGSGMASEVGVPEIADLSIVTFSKAIGCIGGAVCGSNALCDAVTNFGRAYIYSTSVPPASAAAIEAAVDVMQREPQRQRRVRDLARHVRAELRNGPFPIPDGDSPIIPIILGSGADALEAAERLLEKGLFVPAIRPPTVPPNAARLRVTLSSEHSDAQIAALLDAVREWKK